MANEKKLGAAMKGHRKMSMRNHAEGFTKHMDKRSVKKQLKKRQP